MKLSWSQSGNGNWNGKVGEITMMVVAYHTDTFWWVHPKLPGLKGRSVQTSQEGMKVGQELCDGLCEGRRSDKGEILMGRFDGQPEIPVLRLELEGIKYSVLAMLDVKHGEMQMALERGIDLAYKQLPAIVAERVREGIVEAATRATDKAMKEYFGPGGAGYEKIIQQIITYVEGQEVGPRVEIVTYAIADEDGERAPRHRKRNNLEAALNRSGGAGEFIWKVEAGKPWMKMYFWNLGVWSVVAQEQR